MAVNWYMHLHAAVVLVCLLVAGVEGAVGGAWIDMSHPFSNDTIYWPGNRRFSLTNVFKGQHPNGFWYV